MTGRTRALWYVAPGKAEIRTETLPEGPSVEVEVAHTLLSRGTERLVWGGRVPEGEWSRMRAPMQGGDFPFPVKYGYAAAGVVTAGPEGLLGRRVFALAPHQERLRVEPTQIVEIPDGVPTGRATLAANMETALNAVWDAEPRPGARVLVVGLGLVGCLVMAVLSRRRDLEVTACDILDDRAPLASDFGVSFRTPPELEPVHDVAFHTSATGAGLAAALGALVFEGTCVELSWYGARPVEVPLGHAFHSQRLTLRSSQVGHVAPSRRARMTHRDRLAAALALLDDPRLDRLLSERVAFDDLPVALPDLLAPGATGIAALVNMS